MASHPLDDEAVFIIARKIESPAVRTEYVQQACRDHPQLLARVETLLRIYEQEKDFLQAPAASVAATVHRLDLQERPGIVIGHYKLLQRIGEGGFGVVFMADQESPIHRTVALKIIKPGMDSREVVARFEAERQALAMMNHPNIAHVFDGGVTESGRPYFVMELVKGVSITEYCDKNDLPTENRLQLFIDVCRAIQHAHQKGIIHRDLKPSNIMVTLHDGKPVVKVIDFGVSKAINQRLTEKTLFTAYGHMVGTPQYMSPEQAEMSGLDVDTRSDVYSLGVLLYELLTGSTPLEADALRTAGYAEIQRMIREIEPPRPSVRLSSSGERLTAIAKHRHLDPGTLQRLIRGDLDWIVMKALDKDRGRRYGSAKDFAVDIERFLANDAVEAHPPSTLYRLKKFVRRRKSVAVTVATVTAALIVGTIGTTLGMVWAVNEKTRAVEASVSEARARMAADEAFCEANRQRYISDMFAAGYAWGRGEILMVKTILATYASGTGNEHLRRWEWYYLWRSWNRNDARLTENHFGTGLNHFVLSGDGRRLALVNRYAPFISLWDVTASPPQRIREIGKDGVGQWGPYAAALSYDGNVLAYCTPSQDTLIVEDMQSNSQTRVALHDGVRIDRFSLAPNGSLIAVASNDCKVRLYDVMSGECLTTCDVHGSEVWGIAFTRDGEFVATGDEHGSVLVWRTASGELHETLAEHLSRINDVAVSPDGSQIAASCDDGTVKVWEWPSGKLTRSFSTALAEPSLVSFSRDGSLLAVNLRQCLQLWDLTTGADLERIHGNRGGGLGFIADGRLIFRNQYFGQSMCDTRDLDRDVVLRPRGFPMGLAMCGDDGRLTLAAFAEVPVPTVVQRWCVDRTGITEAPSLSPGFRIGAMAASAKGMWALGDADSSTVRLFQGLDDPNSTKLSAGNATGVSVVAFSEDGSRIACGHLDGQAAVWKWNTASSSWVLIRQWQAHNGAVKQLAFRPNDIVTLVTAGHDWILKVWNVGTGDVVRQWEPVDPYAAVAFSRRGDELAVGDLSGSIALWKEGSDNHREFRGHEQRVRWLKFLSDEQTLISASSDGTLRVWDLVADRQRFALEGSSGFVHMAISPEETTVAAAMTDGTIRLYRCALEEDVTGAD